MGGFNQLDPAEEERLWCLTEEIGEVLQAIGKIGRHGYASSHPDGGPNNRSVLTKELGHVLYSIHALANRYDVKWSQVEKAAKAKSESIKPYQHHQRSGS
jgi:NTP pyrophosphatase (non-canonical NTP hydrolase)